MKGEGVSGLHLKAVVFSLEYSEISTWARASTAEKNPTRGLGGGMKRCKQEDVHPRGDYLRSALQSVFLSVKLVMLMCS